MVLLLMISTNGTLTSAQERSAYLGVSGSIVRQGADRPCGSPSCPRTGASGTAFAASLEAGSWLSDWLSLSFEATVPARFEAIQETDYFSVFRTKNRHRDLFLSGLFRIHYPEAHRLALTVAAGPTVVREDTRQSVAYQGRRDGSSTGGFGPYGDEGSLSRWTVGVTLGAELGVRVSPRVQIMPGIRLHLVDRADIGGADTPYGFLGLNMVTVAPGLAVRLTL
jgi:hypothetical protein